jgi:hypothetical protein
MEHTRAATKDQTAAGAGELSAAIRRARIRHLSLAAEEALARREAAEQMLGDVRREIDDMLDAYVGDDEGARAAIADQLKPATELAEGLAQRLEEARIAEKRAVGLHSQERLEQAGILPTGRNPRRRMGLEDLK